jgi:prepilin-type N-terminal cleavage/methylation domain-containing protein
MKKGFTLIEFLIVAAIIAILAAIAVPMYQRYIDRSRNAASQAILHQIAQAEMALDSAQEIPESYVASSKVDNILLLTDFGFRPDPNVAFNIQTTKDGNGGFVAFAGNINPGSPIFFYDTNTSSVAPWNKSYTPPNGVSDPADGDFNTYTFVPASTANADVAENGAEVKLTQTCKFESPAASASGAGKVTVCSPVAP